MTKNLGIASALIAVATFIGSTVVGCGAADPTTPGSGESAPATETLAEGLTVLASTNDKR